MPHPAPKLCVRCQQANAVKGERYCKSCRGLAIEEMKQAGYLRKAPRHVNSRSPEQRENVNETKHGTGHG